MNLNDISLKELLDWRSMSNRSKKTFIVKLKTIKEVTVSTGGGNYWVRAVSGVKMSYKLNDPSILKERLEHLLDDLRLTDRDQTKVMYNRNVKLLQNFIDFDFSKYRPSEEMIFLSQPSSKAYIKFSGISVKINPSLIFSYENIKGNKCVGGIWFITKLDGYQESEVGLYSEAIYKYLTTHYSKDFEIDPKFCVSIDLAATKVITYNQILNKKVSSIFDSTIQSLKNEL